MEKERAVPRREDAEAGPVEARPRGATATRCPFCHEPCASEEQVRVCRECLSRHHAACWAESRACASCGAGQALAGEAELAAAEQGAVAAADGWSIGTGALLVLWTLVAAGVLGVNLGLRPPLLEALSELGVELPLVTQQLLTSPWAFAALALALIPAGALAERAGWRSGRLAGVAAAIVVVGFAFLVLLLPLLALLEHSK